MTTAPTTERPPPAVTVMPTPELWCADGPTLCPARLLTIRAATKAGDIANLYFALDCGTFWRILKIGAKLEAYAVKVNGREATDCTCGAGTFHAELTCKHRFAVEILLKVTHDKVASR